MKKILLCALFLAGSLLLSGCDKIVLVPGQSSGSISENKNTVSNDINDYPVILNGTEITASPETVISLTPAYTEILFEMGYGDRLIAVSDYCDYPENVKELPKVSSSTDPDIDKISELKPDLLITGTPIVTKDKAALESLGIKVLTVPSPTSLGQLESIYKLFGLAFDGMFIGEDKGEQAYGAIQSSVEKLKDMPKIKFVYITAALSPAGGNTFESSVLSLFGENAAKDGTAYDYPAESLAESEIDVVFLNDEYSIDNLKKNKVYSDLEAVKEERVITLNNKYFERPSARLAELIESIAEELSGDKYAVGQENSSEAEVQSQTSVADEEAEPSE